MGDIQTHQNGPNRSGWRPCSGRGMILGRRTTVGTGIAIEVDLAGHLPPCIPQATAPFRRCLSRALRAPTRSIKIRFTINLQNRCPQLRPLPSVTAYRHPEARTRFSLGDNSLGQPLRNPLANRSGIPGSFKPRFADNRVVALIRGCHMTQAESFLESFSQIEKYLRQRLSLGREASFSYLVDSAAHGSSAIKYFSTDLKEFADLRNAIVHERTDGHVIAEPLDITVWQIQHIADSLLKPPSLMKLIHQPAVTIGISDPLGKAISLMSKHNFSQLPIVGPSGCEGVLTANTIVRWLGSHQDIGIVSIDDTRVDQVLPSQESSEVHRLIGKESSIFTAIEIFNQEQAAGRILSAILVTQNGRRTESILGLMTFSDVPSAYNLISRPTIQPK